MHSFRHCQNCQMQSNNPQTWSFSGFLDLILFNLFQQNRTMLKSWQNNHPCSQCLSHASHFTLKAQVLAVVSKALQGRPHYLPSYLVLCYPPQCSFYSSLCDLPAVCHIHQEFSAKGPLCLLLPLPGAAFCKNPYIQLYYLLAVI